MFGSKSNKKLIILSHIDDKCIFNGDFSFNGGLQINGTINGNVIGVEKNSTLVIGESAVIKGKIEADCVLISGTVEGPVLAKESVLITKTGYVKGDVSYYRVQMENGCRVEGNLLLLKDEVFDKN